jgi:predicted membrane protein
MKRFLTKCSELLFKGFLVFTFMWISFALVFDVFFIYLQFNNPEKAQYYSNEIMVRIDGTYKNNPKSIWYVNQK